MRPNLAASHRSGFIAVLGRPNVGKSTLINNLIGQKIAAVSSKPQTTRQQQLGILSRENIQIIFIDTPGLHKPIHKLGEYMNEEATEAIDDTDLNLFLVDASHMPPHEEDRMIANLILSKSKPDITVLALNKIDQIEENNLPHVESTYHELLPGAVMLPVSATRGDNLDTLLETLIAYLPESPPYYPKEQITDLYEREIAADLIRASALTHLREEVPHSIAVRIDEYKERNDHGAYIAATLFVERDSQKGIVIGEGGKMIKRIGSLARHDIEAMSGRNVYIRLRVKVRKNWRNDNKTLRLFGFGGR